MYVCMYVCMYGRIPLDYVPRMYVCMYVCTLLGSQVWTEARVGAEWIHIDPCEAAVNEPLIYQGWGKNQTFIFAYKKENSDKGVGMDDVTNPHSSIGGIYIT